MSYFNFLYCIIFYIVFLLVLVYSEIRKCFLIF